MTLQLCRRLVARLNPGVTTIELDNLAAETAMTMSTKHPDYAMLAAHIAVSAMHKGTKKVRVLCPTQHRECAGVLRRDGRFEHR